MYPPQSSQKAHILANYAKFTDHFLVWTTRNGKLKFLQQITQNLSSSPILTVNHAELAKFVLFLITLLFLVLDIRKTGSTPCLHELHKSRNLQLEFAKCSLLYISQNVLITCINSLQSKHHLSSEPQITNVPQHWKEKKIILILQNR